MCVFVSISEACSDLPVCWSVTALHVRALISTHCRGFGHYNIYWHISSWASGILNSSNSTLLLNPQRWERTSCVLNAEVTLGLHNPALHNSRIQTTDPESAVKTRDANWAASELTRTDLGSVKMWNRDRIWRVVTSLLRFLFAYTENIGDI